MKFFEFVERHGETLFRAQGEHIFHQGEGDRNLYLIQQGVLKAYYLSEDGKETVKSFIGEGNVIGNLTAAHTDCENTFGLVALSDCVIRRFSFRHLYEASKSDVELSNSLMDILLAFAIKKERREKDLLCMSAQERYEKLLEETPDLIGKITQNDIAKYLGITPVALSRIKRRVCGK
ncbi:Crp/Fnr family transcriptional regulator [Veronia pacifica]|uniref:Cyclic nucleotide-binding domain-containing protein n=1 Tax=Veronia pacifica TaxID=1080227 RepID=A0A1C3EAG0_9GAMM|nr:Crp/Fnr family transcriptional regulator [Veronia pacifica]ODA30222.1 hypothetical protein A8L45_20685 [Veronia pacifica]